MQERNVGNVDIPYSQLVFSSASVPLSKTLGQIKKASLSIRNRLESIGEDARYVDETAARLQLPVIANERCGSWYVRPSLKAGSAYFKSTDGHYGQWRFNLRRLNTHIFSIISGSKGAILVDSTRQGKHLPDAFSRTVPIWCSVMNKLLFPDHPASKHVFIPQEVVGDSEHEQIEARLGDHLEAARALDLDLEGLRTVLKRPVIPSWTSRSLDFSAKIDVDIDDVWILHCVMASRFQASDHGGVDAAYVQGSGDDAEFWGHGITPEVFWSHDQRLLGTTEGDLPALIAQLIERDVPSGQPVVRPSIAAAPWLNIWSCDDIKPEVLSVSTCVIVCSPEIDARLQKRLRTRFLHLRCGQRKLGSRDLRTQLEKLPEFISKQTSCSDVVVACSSGHDLSVGTAVALLCRYCNDDGTINLQHREGSVDKTLIRQRLAWITSSMPEANPSRATLNAVNSFLMKPD